MDDSLYKTLKFTAFFFALMALGWSLYDSFLAPQTPGGMAFQTGEQFFEDADYPEALSAYEQALDENPEHLPALRGLARSLMQIGRNAQALAIYDQAIKLDPEGGATYANRGILYDRIGEYRLAIDDYEKALSLDPELAEGPHWLTRFLRLQAEKPPTIGERAGYLRQELAKPEGERMLRNRELDALERPYQH